MERKIGEIFEYNGEWYQCVAEKSCDNCAFKGRFCSEINHIIGYCSCILRLDDKDVAFKKLEKVGEPFERNGYMYQEYKTHTYPLLMSGDAKIPTDNGFAAIIKNKEDMEEKKVHLKQEDIDFLCKKFREIAESYIIQGYNKLKAQSEFRRLFSTIEESDERQHLREFDIEAAKAGKPVCTRDGRKARIICFDRNTAKYHIVALIECKGVLNKEEEIKVYNDDGKYFANGESSHDLMMLPEKKSGWINIYKGNNGISKYDCCAIVFNTKEEAIQYAQNDNYYITTVKIEWEE